MTAIVAAQDTYLALIVTTMTQAYKDTLVNLSSATTGQTTRIGYAFVDMTAYKAACATALDCSFNTYRGFDGYVFLMNFVDASVTAPLAGMWGACIPNPLSPINALGAYNKQLCAGVSIGAGTMDVTPFCGYSVSTVANTTLYVPFVWTLPTAQTATTSGTSASVPGTSTTLATRISAYGCFIPSRDGSVFNFCSVGTAFQYGVAPGQTMLVMLVPTESVGVSQDNFAVTLGSFNSALTVTSTTSFKKVSGSNAANLCVFADTDAVNVAVTNTAPYFKTIIAKPTTGTTSVLLGTLNGASALLTSFATSALLSTLF